MLERHNLAGQVQVGKGDYLMTVDANVGFNKLDQVIVKAVEYQVDLSNPAAPTAQVMLHYRNPTTGAPGCLLNNFNELSKQQYRFPACYWNYWRVYTHPDTRLLDTSVPPLRPEDFLAAQTWDGVIDTSPGEGNTIQSGGLVVVPKGESQTVQLGLALSPDVLQSSGSDMLYRLRVQKQPGIDALFIRVSVRLPGDHSISDSQSGWSYDSNSQIWSWQGKIKQTKDFIITITSNGRK
jgi:hypothetical protein